MLLDNQFLTKGESSHLLDRTEDGEQEFTTQTLFLLIFGVIFFASRFFS